MYKLIRHIETGLNGGETLFFADVNNDGKKEIIIRQSGGFYDSKYYRDDLLKFTEYFGSAELTEANSQLLCITCMTLEGEVIWQCGKPWTDERPYISHASLGMITAADVNNDGKTEILYLLKDRLYMLDGETGEFICDTLLPTEAINLVYCQKTKDGCNIILKCDGESEYGYGKPILAYDSNLKPIWQRTDITGSGHNIVFVDADGDGRDEILEGYALLSPEGNTIWAHDFPSHADQILVSDINNDGTPEVIYCTDAMDFIILDIKGNIIKRSQEFVHPQKISLGKFIPDLDGTQMFLNNKACDGGSFMLDCKGEKIWDFPCNGYAATIMNEGGDMVLFTPNPGRLTPEDQDELIKRAEELGYEDMPITKEGAPEPFIVDGSGKIIHRFDRFDVEDVIEKWNLPRFIQGYYGAGFETAVNDIDNDGNDEIIIYNRQNIWIYKKSMRY